MTTGRIPVACEKSPPPSIRQLFLMGQRCESILSAAKEPWSASSPVIGRFDGVAFDMSIAPDIVIIGAGAAGLAAAIELGRAGLAVLMLDARNRIGGRIFTLSDPVCHAPVELGAEFIHGRPPEIWSLLEKRRDPDKRIRGGQLGGAIARMGGYASSSARAEQVRSFDAAPAGSV